MRIRLMVVSLLMIAAAARAQVIRPSLISVNPPNPKPGDTIVVSISGLWGDPCTVPQSATTVITDRSIRIEALADQSRCSGGCVQVVTPYTLNVNVNLPPTLPAGGAWAIEYYTTACGGVRRYDGSSQLLLATGCNFTQSLTATQGRLTWCNPSWFTAPDAQYFPNYYRIYASKSANGPFTAVRDALSTSTTVDTTVPGTTYYYVEAHGCLITPSGNECTLFGREALLQTNIVSVTVAPTTGCGANPDALCLSGGRFQVVTRWRTATGTSGAGHPVQFSDDSGYFYFFGANNTEVTVKVLNGCSSPIPDYWVFAAGMTNVEVVMTVTDTKTNTVKQYTNPLGTSFIPILDTTAFATCP